MGAEVTRSTEVVLPTSVDETWAMLSDTPRMVALDPLIDRYEPEHGVIEVGTLNRVCSRIGPFSARLVTRTEALEPPRRATFVSVRPARPVRIRAEEALEPTEAGCRLRVTITATPTLPLLGSLSARTVSRMMLTQRHRLLERLRDEMAEG